MIDIHTHIIPALDDGPPDMETSIALGRLALADGISTMISTSHSEESTAVGMVGMQQRLEEVHAAWLAEGIQIRLELGVEIFLQPHTVDDLKSGKLWALAGTRYVLVELPYQPWPTFTEQALHDLQLAGYMPILAHPERYTAIQTDPNLMYRMAERGILGQVTAGALLGNQGQFAQRSAETLVRHRLAQIISTDTHGVTLRKRMPQLTQAVERAAALVGEEHAKELVIDSPARVLNDEPLTPQPEPVPQRKWSIGRLFGRD